MRPCALTSEGEMGVMNDEDIISATQSANDSHDNEKMVMIAAHGDDAIMTNAIRGMFVECP